MKRSALKWLRDVIGKRRIGIGVLLVVQTILGICSVGFAVLLKQVIDNAASGDGTGFKRSFLLLGGLIIFQISINFFARRLEERMRSGIENACKIRLFSGLLRKNYASVTELHSGEWLNRLTSDTVICANGAVDIAPGVVGMAVRMIGAVTMILLLEPKFALILFPGGAAMLLLTYSFRRILKSLHKRVQEADGRLRIFMQEHLENLLIVRSFSAEKLTECSAAEKMAEHRSARMKKIDFSNICNSGFSAAMNGMYLIGLWYCGTRIIAGTITYGTLTAILQLIAQIQTPFAGITGYLPRFYAMTASAERLMESESFGEDTADIVSSDEAEHFYREELYSLGMCDVDFSYGNGRSHVPEKFSIEIKKGEFVAFTGHSGCGKSTLLKLLMCLYPLQNGERYLLTTDNRRIPLTSGWHRLFAYVPQGNQLMSGTIRAIIAFARGKESADDEEIMTALKIACADEFVGELENGIDTVLGERGQGLSEGQLQRIAIARAVFSGNPVLLLDEATSALDEPTERRLLENIRKMTDITVLIVTHRPAALEICDKIIRMERTGDLT